MARPLSSSLKAQWRYLENFSVMTICVPNAGASNNNFLAAGFGGTMMGLAAISSTAGAKVQDITASVDLYTIAVANTAYIGTPSSPLFYYNYPVSNKIGLSTATTLFAGIVGTIPKGFQVAVACLRSTALQSITVYSGPATLKYFKLIFTPQGGSQFVTVSAGSNALRKLSVNPGTSSGAQAEMEFIHLGPGGPTIAPGDNLTIAFDLSTTTYLVGIFLLES
jgi:hypothetical protein